MKAAKLWESLEGEREDFLTRAREVSSLTIPFLVPPDGTTSTTQLPTPFQGTGAEGVNNLASKLILALFPPSTPFFRLVVEPAAVRELAAEQGADPRTVLQDVEADVAVIEAEVQSEIESRSLRPSMFEVFRHLIVAGNVLIRWEGAEMRVFSLPQYVIKRDGAGNILTIVTRENVGRSSLPEAAQASAKEAGDGSSVNLYTAAERQSDGRYKVWQEAGEHLFNTDTVDEKDLPYIAPRMFHLIGESYGRGLGEHYLGDLASLEALSRAIVLSSAAAAHIVWLVNPNGFTKVSDLQKARTGAYIPGLPTDIAPLRLEKNADLQIAASTAARIETKLQRVFLLNTAAQRQAERVTAAEIRFVAQQLEDALGGTYALMNEQLQLPIVTRVMTDMDNEGRLPDIPPGIIKPKVVTGLEGLGRNLELDKLRTLFGVAAEILGPQVLNERADPEGALTRIAAAVGIDLDGILKTDEQRQQEQQQAQQASLAQEVAAPIAGAAAGPVAQAMVDNAQQQ